MKKTILVCLVISSIWGPLACNRNMPDFPPVPSVPSATPSGTPSLVVSSPTTTPTVTPSSTASSPVPSPSATPTPSNVSCGANGVTPAQATALLAGNLFPYYEQTQTGNIFYSPFSILVAMAMAQEGANGQTACQMQTALNLNSDAATRQSAFQQMIASINAPGKNYTLDTSDDLWVQQGFNLLPAFPETLSSDYAAGVTNVDFLNDPSGALNTINGAVSQQTAGFIPTLLSSGDINTWTRFILTNAIYFKADWQYQFPVTDTDSQTFYLDSGSSEAVSMMHETLTLPVYNYSGAASVLALPYKGGDASMYIFLPPQGGTAALEAQLTPSQLLSWLQSLPMAATYNVNLSLPRFTFSTSYDLTTPLKQLGMPFAFDSQEADFSGIDGAKDLSISKVVHKAYVDVSESGTTAAAATGVVGCSICLAVIEPMTVSFTADHPFIFAIVDKATGAVLFLGRVEDPLSAN